MVIGVCLMLCGVCAPLLMVTHVLESTFLLNFLSYGASLTGLILGMIGLAFYGISKNKN
jgi:hypothetical protein